MGYTDRADDAPNVAQLGREVHNAFVGSNLNVGMHVHERGSGQFFCPLTLARRGLCQSYSSLSGHHLRNSLPGLALNQGPSTRKPWPYSPPPEPRKIS